MDNVSPNQSEINEMSNTAKNVVAIDSNAKIAEIEANNAKLEANANKRNAFYEAMRDLGELDRLGKASPFKSAMLFQSAVRDGYVKATSDEARDAYKAYAGIETGDVVGVDKVTASLATQTSCLLTFGLPASVHAGENLYVQIDQVIHGYAAKDLTGSKIRCYEKANRELHKVYEAFFKANGGDVAASLAAAMKACDDAAIAQWLIKEGATKIGDGSEADGDGATGENEKAKSSPLDRLETVLKSAKSLVSKEFADNAALVKAMNALSAEYHKMASAALKSAA